MGLGKAPQHGLRGFSIFVPFWTGDVVKFCRLVSGKDVLCLGTGLACFHHNFIFDEKDVISYFIIPGIINLNVNDGVCLSVPYPRQFNLVDFQVLKLFKSNLYDATERCC